MRRYIGVRSLSVGERSLGVAGWHRSLPDHNQMRCVCLLELLIASLGESQALFRSFAQRIYAVHDGCSFRS